ncbi:MAG: hypothetical protein VXU48_03315, partial [Verrucomicrobiota bacterium]|nr:hypothetical protein [Verrucomicrobiota bacterium]
MAIFKNQIATPSSRMRRMLKQSLFPFSMIFLGVAILWGFWFISQLGPKDVDMSKIRSPFEVPEAVKAIQQES